MKKTLLTLVLIGLISSSFAFSARELKEYCSKEDNISLKLGCLAYVRGFLDGMTEGMFLKTFTVGTVIDMFKREMEIHPEKGDDYPGLVLRQMLLKHDLVKYDFNNSAGNS